MNTTKIFAAAAVVIVIGYGAGAWAHTAKMGSIEIIHPWVEPSESYSSRAHPTISNEGENPITLIGAETSIAEQMLIIREGLVLDKFVIAGEDVVSFGDDGLHLTLVGLKEPLADGTHFPVTFHFDGAESFEFHMVVGESTMMPGMEMPEMPGEGADEPHEMHDGGESANEHDHHGDGHGTVPETGESRAPAAMHDAITPLETVLTITHDPIEAIGWPEMTTDFGLADGADIADVEKGDRVYFVLIVDSEGIYAISSVSDVERGVPTIRVSEWLGEGIIETIAGR